MRAGSLRPLAGGGRLIARLQSRVPDVPEHVGVYSAAVHGTGGEGIRRWRREAVQWLDANPGRVLPAGDVLGVFRESGRLLEAEWFGPAAS